MVELVFLSSLVRAVLSVCCRSTGLHSRRSMLFKTTHGGFSSSVCDACNSVCLWSFPWHLKGNPRIPFCFCFFSLDIKGDHGLVIYQLLCVVCAIGVCMCIGKTPLLIEFLELKSDHVLHSEVYFIRCSHEINEEMFSNASVLVDDVRCGAVVDAVRCAAAWPLIYSPCHWMCKRRSIPPTFFWSLKESKPVTRWASSKRGEHPTGQFSSQLVLIRKLLYRGLCRSRVLASTEWVFLAIILVSAYFMKFDAVCCHVQN